MGHVRKRLAAPPSRVGWITVSVVAVACLAGSAISPGVGTTSAGAAPAPKAVQSTITGVLASFYRPPSPLIHARAGSIIRSRKFDVGPALPTGTKAYRVLFHTTSATGGDLAESGVIVVPGGTPPPGGFPIVSWAHGTTGVASM